MKPLTKEEYLSIANEAGVYLNSKHPIYKTIKALGKDNLSPKIYISLAEFYKVSLTKVFANYGVEWSLEEGCKAIEAFVNG